MNKLVKTSSLSYVLHSFLALMSTHNLWISKQWLRAYYTPSQWRRLGDVLILLSELGLVTKTKDYIFLDKAVLNLYSNTFEAEYVPPMYPDFNHMDKFGTCINKSLFK